MPTERFPRERFAADLAHRLRASEGASNMAGRPPGNGPTPASEPSGQSALPSPAHGLLSTDSEGHVFSLNPTAAEMTGWSADDALGKPAYRVLHVVAPERARDVVADALGTGAVYHLNDARIRRKDGREVDADITVAPVIRRGSPSGVVVVLSRPSESGDRGGAQLEGLIAVSHELVETAPFKQGAERILDLLLSILEADRAVLALSEAPPDAGRTAPPGADTPHLIVSPREPIGRRRPDAQAVHTAARIPEVGHLGVASLAASPLTVAGHTVGTLSVASTKRDWFGAERARLLASVADSISALWRVAQLTRGVARRGSELQLLRDALSIMSGTGPIAEKAERLLRAVSERARASFAALGTLDASGKVADWLATAGPAAPDPQGETGTPFADAAAALGSPIVVRDLSETTAWPMSELGASVASAVALPINAHGETVGVMVVASAQRDGFDPELVRLLSAVADCAGMALLHVRRDVSLSEAAHALRNPMTPVLGYTELLMGPGVAGNRSQEWLHVVHDATKRTLKVIDDLLQVSHIWTHDISLDLDALDLAAVLARTAASFRSDNAHRDIVVDVPTGLPEPLADPSRLAQIVANLLSNALKFSPGGGQVRISAHYEWGKRRVVVSISDEGVGISEEDQRRIFAPFQRAYRPATRDVHGAGLGLSIVKGLVELMGGTVWVESELDRGSTFHFAFRAVEPSTHSRSMGPTER